MRIGSYIVIAVPIFAGYLDYLDPTDLSRKISENSFVCMYLIYNFSKLVDMSQKISKLAGVTHRVSEVIEKDCSNYQVWSHMPISLYRKLVAVDTSKRCILNNAYNFFCKYCHPSIVGSVVECSPATRAARVRFPDDANPLFVF